MALSTIGVISAIVFAIIGILIKVYAQAKEAQIESLKQQLDFAKNNDIATAEIFIKKAENLKVALDDKEKEIRMSEKFIDEIQELLNNNKQELDLKDKLNQLALVEIKRLELKANELEKERNAFSELLESKRKVSNINIPQYQTVGGISI